MLIFLKNKQIESIKQVHGVTIGSCKIPHSTILSNNKGKIIQDFFIKNPIFNKTPTAHGLQKHIK